MARPLPRSSTATSHALFSLLLRRVKQDKKVIGVIIIKDDKNNIFLQFETRSTRIQRPHMCTTSSRDETQQVVVSISCWMDDRKELLAFATWDLIGQVSPSKRAHRNNICTTIPTPCSTPNQFICMKAKWRPTTHTVLAIWWPRLVCGDVYCKPIKWYKSISLQRGLPIHINRYMMVSWDWYDQCPSPSFFDCSDVENIAHPCFWITASNFIQAYKKKLSRTDSSRHSNKKHSNGPWNYRWPINDSNKPTNVSWKA